MRTALAATLWTLAAAVASGGPVAAGGPVLSLPIDCTLGQTCYIQHFVDRDPGPGVQDYRCGGLTYDGHKGTDFAVDSLARMRDGVNVLAAAPGEVARIRDGVADRIYADSDSAEVEGKECGNGILIRHGDGWETMYCHLAKGTVQVAKGDKVAQGSVLGQVGLSGKTQFPHVHLSVRHEGKVVDPFDVSKPPTCGEDGDDLWHAAPPYLPGGMIAAGFSPGIPDYDDIQAGTAAQATLAPDAPALVLYGFSYGGLKDDVIQIDINGPQGWSSTQETTLEKNQGRFFRAGGKRLKQARWPAGIYTGTVRMMRGDTELGRASAQMVVE